MSARVPYSQQFTPDQTPLARLLPILRQNAGKPVKLRKAIASAFFRSTKDPDKLAGNTLISLRTYGIIDADDTLTPFGKELINAQGDQAKAHDLIGKHILADAGGVAIMETLREIASAGLKIELKSLPDELRQRGIEASSNSSDLSRVFSWLRAARVLEKIPRE